MHYSAFQDSINCASGECDWRAAIDAIDPLVFIHDENYRIIDANQAYIERSGLSREELVGLPYWQAYPRLEGPLPSCREGLERALESADADGCKSESVEELKLDSGEVIVSRSFVVRDGDGNYIHSVHLLEDVTESRWLSRENARIAATLRERESQLNQLFANMTEGVLVVDDEGRVAYANSAAAHLFARSSEEVIGEVLGLPVGGPDAQEIDLRTASGEARTVEMRIRDMQWHASPAHLLNLRDVTERKRVEDDLRQAAIVFDEAHEGIVIADADKNVIAVNRAYSDITGYSRQEVEGKPWNFVFSGFHDEATYAAVCDSVDRYGYWTGELWGECRDGSSFAGLVTIRDIRDELDRRTHYLAVFSDISRIKEYQSQLERLMHADPLTGLPNRLLFRDRLEQAVVGMQRSSGVLAVISIDINDLKSINFSMGHVMGDSLLQSLSQRLQEVLRPEDTIARLGGDEFGILCPGLVDVDEAAATAERISAAVRQPFFVSGEELHVYLSIGLSTYPDQNVNAGELLEQASAAMAQAKSEAVTYRFYSQELTEMARERVQLGSELRHALEEDGLTVHYQPQVDLISGRWIGLEALARWPHAERGWVSPGRFIPVAERVGLVVRIGDWVFERACRDARKWLDAGYDFGKLGVNFAAPELASPDLVPKVLDVLERTGLPPRYVEMEITESLFVDPHAETIDSLQELRRQGLSVAIDDFGTGYSALSYLRDLPIDRLKIDRSFVDGLPEESRVTAITRAIIGLGDSLGFEVIAEGVETERQRKTLIEEGCRQGQGYLFSRPCPVEKLDFSAGLGAD
ncbi:EAL domain-containing protein [Halorhodospira halochloris]|uniref:sensor domain-containing protein n=1 Tax=Halorhodospira halochloris TaxID=1052 RepID=UPI001EE8C4B4|nr:EAL domain-containing protein [Halorhodospira halochloris]MCG5530331.1 EAL domain-containing protein [Halorhodospira halochloris]